MFLRDQLLLIKLIKGPIEGKTLNRYLKIDSVEQTSRVLKIYQTLE